MQAHAADGGKIGLVLMHGKLGARLGVSSGNNAATGYALVAALRAAGYLVETPEMCWSRFRKFDRPYPDCLNEIDTAIADLKTQGASGIVVGGLSLGGNAALAYGASHDGLLGVIGLAPADDPQNKAKRSEISSGIARANSLMAQGKGDEKTSFDDVNTGPAGSYPMSLDTTPRVYLSFNAPDSPANIAANVAKLRAPLLWVAGTMDPTQRGGPGFAFDKAPPNPLNRYVTVKANHIGTPDAATAEVLDWLKTLPARP